MAIIPSCFTKQTVVLCFPHFILSMSEFYFDFVKLSNQLSNNHLLCFLLSFNNSLWLVHAVVRAFWLVQRCCDWVLFWHEYSQFFLKSTTTTRFALVKKLNSFWVFHIYCVVWFTSKSCYNGSTNDLSLREGRKSDKRII